jgi:TonB family protein
MSEKRNKKYALLITLLFAVVMLLILFFVNIRSVLPPKEDATVELDFLSEEGLFEPARLALGEDGILTDAPSSTTLSQTSTETPSGEDLLSQNNEETLALARERERQQQEAAKRQAAIDRASALGQNAFSSQNGSGGTSAVQGGSAQGSTDGSASGVLNGSSALKGRFGGSQIPNAQYNESGRVAVNIIVDATGKVTSATVALSGTTTTSSRLRQIAERAALQAKFSAEQGAKSETGVITYVFKLN